MIAIVSYAYPGMRGVVTRGVRIASQLTKKVIFIHAGETSMLKKAGFDLISVDFNQLVSPSELKLPRSIDRVVFCDMPTNFAFQLSVFLWAKQKKIPVIIVENMYRRNQLEEKVFKNFIGHTDAMFLNGPRIFKMTKKNIRIVSPLDPPRLTRREKEGLRQKYGIRKDHRIILCMGYNKEAVSIIERTAEKLRQLPLTFVVVGIQKSRHLRSGTILLPFLNEKDYLSLLSISDCLIGKRGYLQIIEALILGVPVLTVGSFRGFLDDWIDPKIRKAVPYFPHYCNAIPKLIRSILFDKKTYKKIKQSMSPFIDPTRGGSYALAKLIEKVRHRPCKPIKKLAVTLSFPNNLSKLKALLRVEKEILPIIISTPYLDLPTGKYLPFTMPDPNDLVWKNDILKSSFCLHFSFSTHDSHGLAQILPWHTTQIDLLKSLLHNANKIIVIGKQTRLYLRQILKKAKK